MEKITADLFALQDKKYRDFHAGLMPEIDKERIIGVRTPDLRKYARELSKTPEAFEFLQELPHRFYEENNLHGALLGLLFKDLDQYLEELERFLPYVDNWATCDMLGPKIFKKDPQKVFSCIECWMKSEKTYTIRFAIVTLMGYYLDEEFSPKHLKMAAEVSSQEYYVKMAVAWYFSVALVKQYDAAISWFTEPKLEIWTHNKALQKAVESRRISLETKEYLRTLKIREKRNGAK